MWLLRTVVIKPVEAKVDVPSKSSEVEAVVPQQGVQVIKVNTLNVRGKARRCRTPFEGRAPHWKKAIVTLRKEDKISLV